MTDSAKYRSHSQFEEFLLNFYGLNQNARIHSDNHTLVIRGTEKFSESINNCVENESLTLKISNDQLFIDDEKLPYNRTTKILFDNIIRYFDTRGLEGVRFLEAVKHVSAEEILAFLRLLEQSGQKPEPWTRSLLYRGSFRPAQVREFFSAFSPMRSRPNTVQNELRTNWESDLHLYPVPSWTGLSIEASDSGQLPT